MNSMEKPGILFDMDGTLWDSSENIALSWRGVTRTYPGLEKDVTQQELKAVMGLTMDNIAAKLFAVLPHTERLAVLQKCCEAENAYLRIHGGVLYDGVEQAFRTLCGRYRLFIVSNCQAGYIEAFLDHYGFQPYIEDTECFGNNGKPKSENIRLVCRRNHVERAVYVGDIQGDYDASKQAGIGFIHAAYGFGRINVAVPAIQSINEITHAADAFFGQS